MRGRLLLAMSACFLLQACQPPTYDILARSDGARLVFVVRGSGSWPFRSDENINADWLEVRDARQIVWAIERDPERPDCRSGAAAPPFPLTYGELPQCYRTVVVAHAVRNGVLYRVSGYGFRSGQGHFRIGREVRNLAWSEVEEEVRAWLNLAEPRSIPTAGDQRNAISNAAVTAAENAATSQ